MLRFCLLSLAIVASIAMAPPCLAGQMPECRDGIYQSSTECGTGATATGTRTTAIGSDVHVIGDRSTAVGARAATLTITGSGPTAVGADALAAGANSTAIGRSAAVGSVLPDDIFPTGANGGTALGAGAFVPANADNGTAVGINATASGGNSTALGAGAEAAFTGSTAIGVGSKTQRSHQVMLGGGGTSITLGDIAASTSEQAGPVALMTVDATGTVGRDTQTIPTINGSLNTLAAASAAQGTRVTALEQGQTNHVSQIAALQNADAQQASQIASLATASALQAQRIVELQGAQAALFDLAEINRRDIRKANEGVAMALAMESPGLPAGTSFALSGGVGYFQGRTAATSAFSARVGRSSSVSAGVGVGFDSGEVGARAGFQVAW